MTLNQVMRLSSLANKYGFAVAVKNGLVQIQRVTYDKKGNSTIEPKSEWIGYDEALSMLTSSGNAV